MTVRVPTLVMRDDEIVVTWQCAEGHRSQANAVWPDTDEGRRRAERYFNDMAGAPCPECKAAEGFYSRSVLLGEGADFDAVEERAT